MKFSVGDRVRQASAAAPEYAHHVGRVGLVVETMVDELGNEHVKTDDGVWCPSRFIEVLGAGPSAGPSYTIDDEPQEYSFGELRDANTFDIDDEIALRGLALGESITIGGGAMAETVIRRVR